MKLLTTIALLFSLPFQLAAIRYNYSYYGDVIHSAPGLTYSTHFNEQSLGIELHEQSGYRYNSLNYLVVSSRNAFLVTNSSNNITFLTQEFTFSKDYLDKLDSEQKISSIRLNAPLDVFVNQEGIYILDSKAIEGSNETYRIIQLNFTYQIIDIKENVHIDLFNVLKASHIVVDEIEIRFAKDQSFLALLDSNKNLMKAGSQFELASSYTGSLTEAVKLVNVDRIKADTSKIYVLDSKNLDTYRIVVLNYDLEVIDVFESQTLADYKDLDSVSENEIINSTTATKVELNRVTAVPLMASPEDLVIHDNLIYIVTSQSNALIVVNNRYELIRYATQFSYHENFDTENLENPLYTTLNRPNGIDVKDTGIYIADTSNYRIVKLNHQFEVINVFDEVDDVTFTESDLEFEPLKITTDSVGRMYVISKGIYEGVIELEFDGKFNRYTGVNPLVLTPIEIFTRALMTEEQLAKLPRYLPTDFTNVFMDENNFLYTTSNATANNDNNMIQYINPKGIDVLKRNGYHIPKGDIHYVKNMNNYVIEGPSKLVDIAYYKDGIYTVIDQKRSRLFTYDNEGNLLYINGEDGAQSDKFTEGVALGYLNDNLLVLDRKLKTVVVYEHTEFGKKVNEAVALEGDGDYAQASIIWEEVLVLNTNYEVAYRGIGKHYLRTGQYEKAMEYFKLGHDQYYYSKAFQRYRNAIIKQNFGWIMLAIVVIPTGFAIFKRIKKKGVNIDE